MVISDGSEEKLTASACADRTGLTVRALRVYERSGLLNPPRARNGWRLYGRRELTRLNTIGVLKTAGLTLAQIRAVLRRNDPPLQEILLTQLENWQRRKEDADRGQRSAQAALQQLRSHRTLDIDLLCELIRSNHVTGDMGDLGEFMQRILALPAKERAAWASRHNEEVNPQSAQDFQEAVRTRIDPALETLLAAGTPASSPKVQKIIAAYLELMRKHAVRATAIEWLSRATMARQASSRLKQRPTQASDIISSQWTSNPFLVEFFAAAERQSAQCQALDKMLVEVKDSMPSDIEPDSKPAQRLVAKFHAICRKYALGDPGIYSQWAELVRPPPATLTEAEDRRIWGFLGQSIAAMRKKNSRR
jgi:DNA-binding transcriptional MerR regulator